MTDFLDDDSVESIDVSELPPQRRQRPPLPEECFSLRCGDCGSLMELRRSHYGLFYGCSHYPQCRGTLGAATNGRPLGSPGDGRTRRARKEAHNAFDQLWKANTPRMDRDAAYAWLRDKMGLSLLEGHIGHMTFEQCQKLIGLLAEHFPETRSVWYLIENDSDI